MVSVYLSFITHITLVVSFRFGSVAVYLAQKYSQTVLSENN